MKIEEWVATQTLLLMNSSLSGSQKSSALTQVITQAYEHGLRDGELQASKERMYPPGLFPMPPPPPPSSLSTIHVPNHTPRRVKQPSRKR